MGGKIRIVFSLTAGIILLNAIPSFCWEKTYGVGLIDFGQSVLQISNGNFILSGDAYFGKYDVFLEEVDSVGDCVWTKTIGVPGDDEGGKSLQQTSDGGYIIGGGTTLNSGDTQVYLLKTDSAGDCVWAKTFGSNGSGNSGYDLAFSAQQTSDGGYIAAGFTNSFGAGGNDVYLVKTDSDGNCVWTRTFGGSGYDMGRSVQQTSDGGYVIAGAAYSMFLLKTDSNGDCVWSKSLGLGGDYAYSVIQTSDGGYAIAGDTFSIGAGGHDVYLMKTDSSGDCVWAKTFGGSGDDYAYSVRQTNDGGYIVAGAYGVPMKDVYLIKADSNGNCVWTRTFGGNLYDVGSNARQTSDDGYVIIGSTDTLVPDYSIYLIRTDSNGDQVLLPTLTPTVTSTFTRTRTVTRTPTFTRTPTITMTQSITVTETVTMTGTNTRTVTLSATMTPTLSLTATVSATPTPAPALALVVIGNFPQPFNADTEIVYKLTKDTAVEIKIFSITGEIVFEKEINGLSGYNSFNWDGINNRNKKIASGVYLYRLKAHDGNETRISEMRKMTCVR